MKSRLSAKIEDGKVVIEIGVDTLRFAFEKSEYNSSFNTQSGEFEERYKVIDTQEFAEDVLHELTDENSDDGSTMITAMFDEAFLRAVSNGSCGIEENP